jgi:hypothetical protein
MKQTHLNTRKLHFRRKLHKIVVTFLGMHCRVAQVNPRGKYYFISSWRRSSSNLRLLLERLLLLHHYNGSKIISTSTRTASWHTHEDKRETQTEMNTSIRKINGNTNMAGKTKQEQEHQPTDRLMFKTRIRQPSLVCLAFILGRDK